MKLARRAGSLVPFHFFTEKFQEWATVVGPFVLLCGAVRRERREQLGTLRSGEPQRTATKETHPWDEEEIVSKVVLGV